MPTFVDPRANPTASANRASPRLTESSEELTEVYRLCRDNRLYAVERWIQVGRWDEITALVLGKAAVSISLLSARPAHLAEFRLSAL